MFNSTESQPALSVGWAQELLANPSAAMRKSAAVAVATELENGKLSDAERGIAFDIMEMLARDVAQQVREALAEHVKNSRLLPRSIAMTLAQDMVSVALPVIQFSEVLTDHDLIAIIGQGSEDKQIAVAKRPRVTNKVTAALADTENQAVVGAMLANQGAELSADTYAKVLDTFQGDEDIQTLMVKRSRLPLIVTEQLMSHISHELQEQLIKDHDLPSEIAEELILHGRERALAQAVTSSDGSETEQLVATLLNKGSMTPTLVLRTMCQGDLHFLEVAMARLANVPIDNAKLFMFSANPRVFEEFYQKTKLPPALFHAFRLGIAAARQLTKHNPDQPLAGTMRAVYTRRLIDQLVNFYDDVCPAELESVLSQISRQVIEKPAQSKNV